jgi:hypothetical protein
MKVYEIDGYIKNKFFEKIENSGRILNLTIPEKK